MINKKILLGVAIVLAIVIVLLAITKSSDTIQIGYIGILSGQGSAWGISAKNSIDLAVDQPIPHVAHVK